MHVTLATCYRVLGIPRGPLDDWATVHVGPPAGHIGLWIQMWTHYRAVIRGEEIKKITIKRFFHVNHAHGWYF